ncbi:rhomboid family intramembrane serine protease [Methylobacterium sp. B4]|uniref:rhomboid family intramembrane serine protease n=1 Tax=Methylobacterium sp. B4 TaxID=1938755 RepID=UPI000D7675D1|nr:rhomboid family intramembrane serine protease [Methylobacterium sp. B4]PXW63802.1 rhomboid family protein [Methylobacterium sp. B4]
MDASPDLPRQGRVPVFNLPGIVTISIAVLAAIHLVRTVLPDGIDLSVLLNLAFIPARWTASFDPSTAAAIIGAAGEGAGGPELASARQEFARYLVTDPSAMPWTGASYALLHGSWMHLIFNVVWLAAFGAPVARRYGALRYAILALAGIVAGAVLHLLIDPYSLMPLVGASAGISALMAAAARFVFQPPPPFEAGAPWQLPPRPPLQTIPELMRNRTAVLFLGIWFVTNLLFGVLALPLGGGEGPIAWDAHLGGFAAGFFLLPLMERGSLRNRP